MGDYTPPPEMVERLYRVIEQWYDEDHDGSIAVGVVYERVDAVLKDRSSGFRASEGRWPNHDQR